MSQWDRIRNVILGLWSGRVEKFPERKVSCYFTENFRVLDDQQLCRCRPQTCYQWREVKDKFSCVCAHKEVTVIMREALWTLMKGMIICWQDNLERFYPIDNARNSSPERVVI
ncbi:hypothetical protein CIRG_09892 [Coccidioides immitis RMSCC 2394]|uniref:Uncharacterized protein n=1 Tax=Coccidioides immitis RMSCC 2394 TaxID=404692 RepID=A0A0J6YNG6_COCIT|nr:hypothetical protein CIRG_09892 [Coccidioides immitis RMSCC 2394]